MNPRGFLDVKHGIIEYKYWPAIPFFESSKCFCNDGHLEVVVVSTQ